MPRVVAAETLDHLAAGDPAAQRSRRDLLRVHRAMGTRALVSRGWRSLLGHKPAGAPLHILELGAGDGGLLLRVARSLARTWPPVRLCLMDRLDIVSPATRAGFAELGWTVQVEVADVLAWAAASAAAAPGSPSGRWDLIAASLFLHHFNDRDLSLLLAAAAARAERFFACEPRRSGPALIGSHLVAFIGANAVTRQDAVLSVRAGFRGDEVARLWPRDGLGWQTRESACGPFSHCFSAQRTVAGA